MTHSEPPDGEPSPENQRSAVRESIFLGAEVHHEGRVLNGRVRNISATGAYLELDAQLEAGDALQLSFRGFDAIAAHVTRVAMRGVGVRFDEVIDPGRCRRPSAPTDQAAHFEPMRNTPLASLPKVRPRLKLFGKREDG